MASPRPNNTPAFDVEEEKSTVNVEPDLVSGILGNPLMTVYLIETTVCSYFSSYHPYHFHFHSLCVMLFLFLIPFL